MLLFSSIDHFKEQFSKNQNLKIYAVVDSLWLAVLVDVDSGALVASSPGFALLVPGVDWRSICVCPAQWSVAHAEAVAAVAVDLHQIVLEKNR